MLNPDPKRPLNRIIFIAFGVAAISFGLAPLRHGHPFYQNWWGVFGVLFILGAIFKPDVFKA
jgi:hypothetical protein